MLINIIHLLSTYFVLLQYIDELLRIRRDASRHNDDGASLQKRPPNFRNTVNKRQRRFENATLLVLAVWQFSPLPFESIQNCRVQQPHSWQQMNCIYDTSSISFLLAQLLRLNVSFIDSLKNLLVHQYCRKCTKRWPAARSHHRRLAPRPIV